MITNNVKNILSSKTAPNEPRQMQNIKIINFSFGMILLLKAY